MRRSDLAPDIIHRLERLPPPFASHYGVVPTPPPEDAVPLGTALACHERAIEQLAYVRTLAREFDDPYIVSRLLARQEAVSSSSIEGTNSTLDELLSLEEDATDEQRDAALQVRDYAKILDQLVPAAANEGPTIFTKELVCTLHREVMQRDRQYPDRPGAFRTRVVWIGGARDIGQSTYNPAPPSRIETSLSDTVGYMRLEGMQAMSQGLITRMAIAHAHFEAVHPFRDGNGRVGRLLLPLMMAADGQVPLYLSPYIEAHKTEYYASLKAAQQQLNWSEAVGFMAQAITGTVDELLKTRTALVTLGQNWRKRRRFRENSAALRALEILLSYPVVTAKSLAQKLTVSAPAAITALSQLAEASVVQERTGYSRNRIFVAAEVLSILNRPYGSEPAFKS